MLMVTFFALLQVLIDLFRAWLNGELVEQLHNVIGSGGMLFYCSSMVAASWVDVWLSDALDRIKRTQFIFMYVFIPVVLFVLIAVWYSEIAHMHNLGRNLRVGAPAEEERLSAHLIFVAVCMVFTVIAKYQSTPRKPNG